MKDFEKGFFGGSLMMRDPFANDPFFKDNGMGRVGDIFGRMDKMI
jgi:hypothetical protein